MDRGMYEVYTVNQMQLNQAAESGDLDLVKFFVGPRTDSFYFMYAMEYASKGGHLHIVKYFVEQGLELDLHYEPSLYLACMNGRLNIVKYFVEQGMDVHKKDEAACKFACHNGHLDLMKYLIEDGHYTIRYHHLATYMELAAKQGRLDMIKYLETQGVPLDSPNPKPVYKMCYYGHLECLKYALSLKRLKLWNHFHMIRFAICGSQLDIIEYLYEQDIPWRFQANLSYASEAANLNVVRFLLNRKKWKCDELMHFQEKAARANRTNTSYYLCSKIYQEYKIKVDPIKSPLSKFFTSFYTRSLSPPSFSSLVDEPMYEPHLGFLVASYIE